MKAVLIVILSLGIGVISHLIEWLVDYFCISDAPKVSWRLFKAMYDINPYRWQMDDRHPFFGYTHDGHITWVRFSFFTFWRVINMFNNKEKQKKKNKQLQHQRILLEAFQEDIDLAKKKAEQEENRAFAAMNPIIKRIREELFVEEPPTNESKIPDSWTCVEELILEDSRRRIKMYQDKLGSIHYIEGD